MLNKMEKSISIKMLIGEEVRSRINAEKIRKAIANSDNTHILDFNGVAFVSRSFADELCTILDENSTLRLINETSLVKKMIDTVLAGRKRVRQRDQSSDIVKLENMDDLHDYFQSKM